MYKRLLIFGVTGLFFLLGLNYLLIYPLKQTVTRERERQDKATGKPSTPSSISGRKRTRIPSKRQRLPWTKPTCAA
jgi:hypothetical protein